MPRFLVKVYCDECGYWEYAELPVTRVTGYALEEAAIVVKGHVDVLSVASATYDWTCLVCGHQEKKGTDLVRCAGCEMLIPGELVLLPTGEPLCKACRTDPKPNLRRALAAFMETNG